MASDKVDERRKHRRVTIFQEIFFGDKKSRRVDDISEEGMFIATADPFMKGSILDLQFRLFNEDKPISIKVEVRYAQEGVGMGVRFMNLKSEDGERIKKFVGRF